MIDHSRRARPARILLAEDNRTIARLIAVALERTGTPHQLRIVHDGDAAIAALEATSAGWDSPDLVLLDLHMPGKNGFQVLAHVKQSDGLRRIPVILFSSSGSDDDVALAYELHANAYVRKDPNLEALCRTLDSIVQFWLRTAATPS